jgi:hypothetical protein
MDPVRAEIAHTRFAEAVKCDSEDPSKVPKLFLQLLGISWESIIPCTQPCEVRGRVRVWRTGDEWRRKRGGVE